MNKKALVGIAVGVLVAIIVVAAILPSSGYIKNIIQQNPNLPGGLKAISTEIKPVVVKLNGTDVLSATDKDAVIETKFDVSNPNDTTVLLEQIGYDIYANGVFIGHGQIGEKLEGTWVSSNYYTLVEHYSMTVDGKTKIENTGNNPEVWSALEKGNVQLSISGVAYYNTNTAFSGHGDSVNFNFTQ